MSSVSGYLGRSEGEKWRRDSSTEHLSLSLAKDEDEKSIEVEDKTGE
jgi:hypothetical protein